MELVNARLVAEGLGFPEGPIALPDGSIICVEIRRGTLSRISADGSISVVAPLGGGPNGAAIGPDGAVYVCNNGGFEWQDAMGFAIPGNQPADYSGGRIERVDLSTGAVDVLYTSCGDHPLRGPNDLVFDADGGMWFTDHGKQRPRDQDRGGIYYARPDGSEITEVVQPSDFPNGIGLSPDGRTAYVTGGNEPVGSVGPPTPPDVTSINLITGRVEATFSIPGGAGSIFNGTSSG